MRRPALKATSSPAIPSTVALSPFRPDQFCTSAAVAGPNAPRWRRTSASRSGCGSFPPSQSSASVKRESDANDQRSSVGSMSSGSRIRTV